jgi:hypothetical protein
MSATKEKLHNEIEKIIKQTDKKADLISESYKNFVNRFEWKSNGTKLVPNGNLGELNENGELLSQEEFIDKLNTDEEFSKRWKHTI